MCSDTRHLLHDDFAIMKTIYLEEEAFFRKGGDRKSIEAYLNENIDNTYKMMKIEFILEDTEKPISSDESIRDKILEVVKSKDVRNRGGYDWKRYPGGWFNSPNPDYFNHVRGITRDKLHVVEPKNLEPWKAALGPQIGEACKSLNRIGNEDADSYLEKFMCSYDELKTRHRSPSTRSNVPSHEAGARCEMISIGSNREWQFEEEITNQTNCITHTFDCTVKNPRKPNIDSIHFYPYCVSDTKKKKSDGREYMTYFNMIEQTGMTQAPALFKMDVEGFEFDVLTQMLNEAIEGKKTHLLPAQISVELHYTTRMYDLAWYQRQLQSAEIAMFMGMMYRRGGYILANVKFIGRIGRKCYSCVEVLFVRAFCHNNN